MEIEASHDLLTQTETKPSGILQAAKRVRMIFSVMASPNRIDILRILNSKGPLTYSELKSLAGFKSKKESGKFAYHLRKLLRQSLVALNKAERRYTITNLGKLVLSLARQIEERSIVESGKMYVRTSRHSIEEFNSNRITQSLVREANMPLEQAHKITEEVENKVYKFQTVYLTSSLIRETVNSILMEHGYEEFRSKLARLGLPGSDISDMFNNPTYSKNGVEGILSETSLAVFSENLLFNVLPKDITDMHLAGELNISNTGLWNLMPDTVFIDTRDIIENGLNFKGKYLNVSRLKPIDTLEDVTAALPILISVLSREASREIILENFISSILKKFQNNEDIKSVFSKAFISSSISRSYSSSEFPVITLPLSLDGSSIITSILEAYSIYLDHTPTPSIGLSLVGNDHDSLERNSDLITNIVKHGGILSISKNFRSHTGLIKNVTDEKSNSVVSLQSLAINLPRLAYQSNKDETYFRARLALMIKPAICVLLSRKNSILEMMRREMLPVLANITQMMHLSRMNLVINLTGMRESVNNILGHEFDSEEIIQKVLHTAVEVASDQGKQAGDDSIRIAMITDDSDTRLAALDSEKYGNMYHEVSGELMIKSYSQGLLISGRDLLSNTAGSVIESSNSIDRLLNGGTSLNVDVSDLTDSELMDCINKSHEFDFFRPIYNNKVCSSCGAKISIASEVCGSCGSTNFVR
ncbi:MAG TPA: anaerobic ribonucleoside-triphosphate reductase [Nitrososphaeraceae archaeon]